MTAALPGAWHLDAACRRKTATMVLPDARGHRRVVAIAKAKAICATCPVIADCRAWALTLPDPAAWHGQGGGMVAGGMTPQERSNERTGGLICGTDSGYNRHYRHAEPACDACRAAHRDASRRLRARYTWERSVG